VCVGFRVQGSVSVYGFTPRSSTVTDAGAEAHRKYADEVISAREGGAGWWETVRELLRRCEARGRGTLL